jgi:hypothetical protein
MGHVTIMHAPDNVAAAIADDRAFYRENENRNFIVSWNHNLRPTLINEARYMFYNRRYVNRGFGTGSGFNGTAKLPGVAAEQLARINVTGFTDPNIPGSRSRDEMINRFFDTSNYQAPGDGGLGNAARTNGPGPAFFGPDVSVHKQFRITERFRLTFRTDVVNLPNVPVFAAPGSPAATPASARSAARSRAQPRGRFSSA